MIPRGTISQIFQTFYIFIQLKPSSVLDLYTLSWYNIDEYKYKKYIKYKN